MKCIVLFLLHCCFFIFPLFGQNALSVYVLQINDLKSNYFFSNIKIKNTVSVNKISFSFKGDKVIKNDTVFSLSVDHVAFWKHYESADLLIAAIGDSGTDFQKILLFDELSPSAPKIICPQAMTTINVLASESGDKYLYNFICYDAKQKKISAEKVDLSNMKTEPIHISEYIPFATDIRCKILEDGSIELQGFGLTGTKIQHKVPTKFISMFSIQNSIWNIEENSKSSFILKRQNGAILELLCMNHKYLWNIYQIPVEKQIITQHSNKIIISSIDSTGKTTGVNFIIDTDKQALSSLLLPPVAKILFLDDEVVVVALIEHLRIIKIDNVKEKHFIDIPYPNAFNAYFAWIDKLNEEREQGYLK